MIRGTFILTAAGMISRIIGFFYRIFLSRSFGEEAVGLYQLIFPVYVLCLSFTCAGIQTAISQNVAAKTAKGRSEEARRFLYTGAALSLALSLLLMCLTRTYAGILSDAVLHEPRCRNLLSILALTFPFSSVHSCICGYYMGLKQVRIPALSQLAEQILRVSFVLCVCRAALTRGIQPSIAAAVAGLVAGEAAAALSCLVIFRSETRPYTRRREPFTVQFARVKELLSLSVPLTANRVMMGILQSIEAISIPLQLTNAGMDTRRALSTYGVLTGMALPCILFPSAFTNAVSSMVLPTVAQLDATDQKKELHLLIRRTISGCLFLGLLGSSFFLITGRAIGGVIFHSSMASDFILTLSWICPFLYTNTTLLGTINGLAKTGISFLFSCAGLLVRILSVFLWVPRIGIRGYLWGLLLSQLLLFLLCISYLIGFRRANT